MNDPLVQLATQAVIVLIFVLTLLDFLRHRDLPRLEIVLLFGCLTLVFLLSGVSRLVGPNASALGTLGLVIFLAQPYLLLRLVEHFRPVPRLQHAIGLAGLLGTWLLTLLAVLLLPRGQSPGPLAIGLVVLAAAAFVYVETYATVAFVREARVTRGVAQRRLVAIAVGSGLLGGLIVVLFLAA